MTIVHPPSLDRYTNTIEHLDFAPPCQYQEHDASGTEPAAWIVWYRTPLICGCVGPIHVLFCAPCWEYRSHSDRKWLVHRKCGFRHPDPMGNILQVERI